MTAVFDPNRTSWCNAANGSTEPFAVIQSATLNDGLGANPVIEMTRCRELAGMICHIIIEL